MFPEEDRINITCSDKVASRDINKQEEKGYMAADTKDRESNNKLKICIDPPDPNNCLETIIMSKLIIVNGDLAIELDSKALKHFESAMPQDSKRHCRNHSLAIQAPTDKT